MTTIAYRRTAVACRCGSSPAPGPRRTLDREGPWTAKDLQMLVRQNGRHSPGAEVDPAFRYDVLNGLSVRPRAIPARWLYDRSGAELFDATTTLPEYSPPRTEQAILSEAASEIAALTGPVRAVVEFGSGSSAKTPILLSAVNPSAYVPIDICIDVLWRSVQRLSD